MPAPITLSWDPDLDRAEVLSLYAAVGWSAYTKDPVALMRGLAGSHGVLAAREEGRWLVGLARTISDGVAVVYVQDLLVHPQFQRRGIGRALMAELQPRDGADPARGAGPGRLRPAAVPLTARPPHDGFDDETHAALVTPTCRLADNVPTASPE